MAANPGTKTGREFVRELAKHFGWEVTADGYTDTFRYPQTLDLHDGYPPVTLEPNSLTWDETGMLMLAMDGEPLTAEETQEYSVMTTLAHGFTEAFADPFAVERYGVDQVRQWIEEGQGSYRIG